MNVNKRDHRQQTGAEPRTLRSGGRTTAERTTAERTTAERTMRARKAQPVPARDARARGAREFPTQGSAALRPPELAPATGRDPASLARNSARVAHPAGSARATDRARNSTREAHPAGAGREEVPRLRVAPPLPVTVPRAPFVGLILAVVVGGVLGVLVVNTKINENAIRLDKLQRQQSTLDLQEEQLDKQIADAETPGSLMAEARKLGLVESGPPAFLRLPDGRVIGVPQPAGGKPAITSQQGTGG
jgi:hypothetical protein